MTYGNLAYKPAPEIEPAAAEPKTKAKKNTEKRPGKKTVQGLNYPVKIACVIAVSASAMFMVSQFIKVNESQTALSNAVENYRFEESVTSQMAFELEQSIDLSKIEKEATTRLGMQRPEKHQIVYLDVKRDDTTDLTAGSVEGLPNRFMSGIRTFFGNIVKFFSI